jgi:hypothetical protein
MELIYFKEDSEHGLKIKNSTSTDSQAIYRISPVLILEKGKELVYPKVKIQEKDLQNFEKNKIDLKSDEKEIKNKFEVKENIFNKEPQANEACDSNFIDIVDAEQEDNLEFEIKKPEDEEDQRKHLDKYNLFKAFNFVNDKSNLKSDLTTDDDYLETQITFDSIDNRLEKIFGIKNN